MKANITKIKVLEIGKMAAVESDQNSNGLTISKPCFVSNPVFTCIKLMFNNLGLKFFAEIIHLNENFNNFIRSKHMMLFFKFDT